MKIVKKILLVLGAVLLCVVIVYCSSGKWMLRNMLQEKYGEPFTVVNVPAPEMMLIPGVYYACCAPESNPDAVFEIYVGSFWQKIFFDNYPEACIGAELAGQLEERLTEYFGECHVQGVLIDAYYGEMDEVITAEAYLSELEAPYLATIVYNIAVNTDDYEAQDYAEEFDYILEALTEQNTGMSITTNISFQSNPDYKNTVKQMFKSYYMDYNHRTYCFYYDPFDKGWEFYTVRDSETAPKKLTRDTYAKTRKKEN